MFKWRNGCFKFFKKDKNAIFYVHLQPFYHTAGERVHHFLSFICLDLDQKAIISTCLTSVLCVSVCVLDFMLA